MFRFTIAALVFVAGGAGAQELTNCAEEPGTLARWSAIECDVTNATSRAIASLRYGLTLREAGRTVPWSEVGWEGFPPRNRYISGGIEPGETVRLSFSAEPLPDRADPDAIEFDLEVLHIFDVDKVKIPMTSE